MCIRDSNDTENRQILLYGMGDQHLEIIASKLASRYKVAITLEKPKVAFRETIRKKSDIDSKYKKQSGGHGQYGHVKMTFEPVSYTHLEGFTSVALGWIVLSIVGAIPFVLSGSIPNMVKALFESVSGLSLIHI